MNENYRNEIVEIPSLLDYVDGAESAVVYKDRNVIWRDYLPLAENQYRIQKRRTLDVSACATFSVLNAIEAQINYLVKQKLIDSDALERLGVIDGTYRPNFSDRWLAKVSGTTKNGNSSWKVCETFRTKGCVSEDKWPWGSNITTWDEYYSEVDPLTFERAKKILDLIEVKQEWVYFPKAGIDGDLVEIVRKHVKHAPLVISSPVCPSWSRFTLSDEKNIVRTCAIEDAGGTSHASVVFGIDGDHFLVYDHYEPHIKRLPFDYPIVRAWKPVVESKEVIKIEEPVAYELIDDLHFGMRGENVRQLQLRLIKEGFLRQGLATGYFGNHTRNAVNAYQRRYADKILRPAGLRAPTGFVGSYTRSVLNGS